MAYSESNLLRPLHVQNEYSAARRVTVIGGVGGAVNAATEECIFLVPRYDTIRYIICTEKLTGKLPV